jgi:hypothetical protein
MGHDSKSKSKHFSDKDKSKKRHKHGDHDKDHDRKRKRKEESSLHVVDDDVDDGDMWVEKNIDMDGTKVGIIRSQPCFILM